MLNLKTFSQKSHEGKVSFLYVFAFVCSWPSPFSIGWSQYISTAHTITYIRAQLNQSIMVIKYICTILQTEFYTNTMKIFIYYYINTVYLLLRYYEDNTPGTRGWSRLRDLTLAVKSRKIVRNSVLVIFIFIFWYSFQLYAKIWGLQKN